ncbi:hypothetical protein FKM82_014617 [Ascaphus truei]
MGPGSSFILIFYVNLLALGVPSPILCVSGSVRRSSACYSRKKKSRAVRRSCIARDNRGNCKLTHAWHTDGSDLHASAKSGK